MVARRIQDIIESDGIIASEMPLANFYAEEPYTFTNNGYTMKLQDFDYRIPLGGSDVGGRLYWLVANDYEIDVIVWTNRNGYFSGIADNRAYNLTVDSELFGLSKPSKADSYIAFTMRPNSILGLDVEGDDGAWSYSGDRFNQIIEQVGSVSDRPNGASFIAILTNPYEDYDSGRVQTISTERLDYNIFKQEFWVEIAAVRQVEPRMQERDDYGGVEEEIVPTTIEVGEWQIVTNSQFPTGAYFSEPDSTDTVWSVSIRQQQVGSITQYALFIDGILQESTVNQSLAINVPKWRNAITARRAQGQDYDPTDPPEPIIDIDPDPLFDGLKMAGIGLIVVVGLVAVIVLGRR